MLASVCQAEQAALEAVGSGRVTWSGPENDRGAAWEVEITLPNAREIDVLVAPDGSIIPKGLFSPLDSCKTSRQGSGVAKSAKARDRWKPIE